MLIFKSRFKKIFTECISNSVDTRMLGKIIRKFDPHFDFSKITGISDKMVLQSGDAANISVDYYFNTENFNKYITEVINANYFGVDGYETPIYNITGLLYELFKLGYIYDKSLRKIILTDRNNSLLNWGILDEGEEYSFCFASIDIVENSRIVRQNKGINISETYKAFHDLLKIKVIKRDGRIWTWEGDGGLIAFYGEDAINMAVFAVLDFFLDIPFYNAVYNKLSNEIRFRAAIHPGKAIFRNNINLIQSKAIERVKEYEKNYAIPANLVISRLAMQSINPSLQSFFKPIDNIEDSSIYYFNYYSGRKPGGHEN